MAAPPAPYLWMNCDGGFAAMPGNALNERALVCRWGPIAELSTVYGQGTSGFQTAFIWASVAPEQGEWEGEGKWGRVSGGRFRICWLGIIIHVCIHITHIVCGGQRVHVFFRVGCTMRTSSAENVARARTKSAVNTTEVFMESRECQKRGCRQMGTLLT